jgi:hypothetical protein
MKTTVVHFKVEKETKNTVRFKETEEDNPICRTLYVAKSVLGDDKPKEIWLKIGNKKPKTNGALSVVEFGHEKETKNTVRFKETEEDNPICRTLYVSKSILGDNGIPDRIYGAIYDKEPKVSKK